MAAAAKASAASVSNSLAFSTSMGRPFSELFVLLVPSAWFIMNKSLAASKHSWRLALSESSKLLWWAEARDGEDITVGAYDDWILGGCPIRPTTGSTVDEVQSDGGNAVIP